MSISQIILPLVIPGIIGFLVNKQIITRKLSGAEHYLKLLRKIIFNFAIPIFLIEQFSRINISDINFTIYAGYYIPVLLLYTIAFFINYRWHQHLHHKINASATYALGACYSNNIVVGLPVALMTLGSEALPIVFLIVALHSPILFILTSILNAKETTFNWREFLQQTALNPLILSIVIGLSLNLVGFSFPEVVTSIIKQATQPIITAAIFLLGSSLAAYPIGAEIRFIFSAVFLKLMILPMLVWLHTSYLLQLPPFLVSCLVILSSSPTAVNAYLVARQQRFHKETVAGTVAMSTLFSIITIPFWLWWLN